MQRLGIAGGEDEPVALARRSAELGHRTWPELGEQADIGIYDMLIGVLRGQSLEFSEAIY